MPEVSRLLLRSKDYGLPQPAGVHSRSRTDGPAGPVSAEIDPYLEMAEIQRRLYQAGGPAVLFEHPKGSRFPMLANLYGTLERTGFCFAIHSTWCGDWWRSRSIQE